jgi:cyclase
VLRGDPGLPFPPPPGIWTAPHWGRLHPSPPFVTFEDNLTLWIDDLRVELHDSGAPAHTTNDVVAWVPDRSVLFTGDLVFAGGTPFVPMGSVSGSLVALGRVRGFGAETLVPGHGPVSGPEAIDVVAD